MLSHSFRRGLLWYAATTEAHQPGSITYSFLFLSVVEAETGLAPQIQAVCMLHCVNFGASPGR
jgi:hypothetical protein